MLNVFAEVHWGGVAAATVAVSALGGVWFAALFAKQYNSALGREAEPAYQPPPSAFAGQLACTFLNVLSTAVLLRALKVETLELALLWGGVVGLGFQVATMCNIAINPNFPRPLAYARLNAPFFLMGSLLASAILVWL